MIFASRPYLFQKIESIFREENFSLPIKIEEKEYKMKSKLDHGFFEKSLQFMPVMDLCRVVQANISNWLINKPVIERSMKSFAINLHVTCK